jgi:hypothetical protein
VQGKLIKRHMRKVKEEENEKRTNKASLNRGGGKHRSEWGRKVV